MSAPAVLRPGSRGEAVRDLQVRLGAQGHEIPRTESAEFGPVTEAVVRAFQEALEHTEAVDLWAVFGVPTYIEDDEAVFVRFMERGRVDDLERAVDLLQWSRLNEFKRTRIPR